MREQRQTSAKAAPSPKESSQSLILFVAFMFMLLLFVGLGVDMGFAYISRAQLSKAVDAACLDGLRNYSSTDSGSEAEDIARATFAANYPKSGRDVAAITPAVKFDTVNNNITLDVTATTTINTFFIRVMGAIPGMPSWDTLPVGSTAQATRPNVIMSLVLDWSGSMFTDPPNGSGGALNGNLTKAVTSFIDNFDDDMDRASMATFGSFAQLNVAMKHQFKTDIKNAEQNLTNLGRTFSDGGLTIGRQQFQGVTVNPNEKVLRVMIFFTDGFANTFQDDFGGCGVLNLGQSDPYNNANGPWSYSFMSWNNGGGASCGATTFYSIGGNLNGTIHSAGTVTIGQDNQNIWTEGQLRALATANAIRNDNVIIYSIGLGSNPSQINQTLLKQIANINDPSNPTFNSNQPVGEAVFAQTPADLEAVFQAIADKILLRLTK